MKLIRRLRWLAYAAFLSVTAVAVAQDATCPTIVRDALAATDSACAGTGRNEACYGNISLDAQPQPGVSDFTFTKPGDLVDVAGVQVLILRPLDQEADTWGVAMMKLQANLPETLPGQNVTFLLFGDVEIQNAVTSNVEEESTSGGVTLPVTVSSMSPFMTSFTDASAVPEMLNAGTELTADGYFAMAQMLHVTRDDGSTGWVMEAMVTVDGDVSTLPEVDMNGEVAGGAAEAAPELTPMQAFYFKSGTNDAPCEEAPDSGILIQTPEGAGKIDLVVNEAKVTLGSTGYFQAQPGGDMTVTVVEGEGLIEAEGKTVRVPAGTYTTVPIDEDLRADGQPADPQPYDEAGLAALPISILPKTISIAPAIEVTPFPEGSVIIPVGGTWTATTGEFTTGGGCPPGMGEVMSQAGTIGSSNTFTMTEGGLNLEEVMQINSSELPGEMTYSNPEPNVYAMDGTIEGSVMHYEFHVLSETEIDGQFSISVEGCDFNMTSKLTAGG